MIYEHIVCQTNVETFVFVLNCEPLKMMNNTVRNIDASVIFMSITYLILWFRKYLRRHVYKWKVVPFENNTKRNKNELQEITQIFYDDPEMKIVN